MSLYLPNMTLNSKYPLLCHTFRDSGDTVVLDIFRPSSPGDSESDSGSSSRRSSVADVESRRGSSAGCPTSASGHRPRPDGEERQQSDTEPSSDQATQKEDKTRADSTSTTSGTPRVHPDTGRVCRTPDAKMTSGLPPLEEAEEPSAQPRRVSYPPAAEAKPQPNKRENRCGSVPKILVHHPDGKGVSCIDGNGAGDGVQGSDLGEVERSVDKALSKIAKHSKHALVDSNNGNVTRGENEQLRKVASELSKNVIKEALEMYANTPNTATVGNKIEQNDENMEVSSDDTTPAASPKHSPSPEPQKHITSTKGTASPNDGPRPTNRSPEGDDMDPRVYVRPDTPINEVVLRRYGASCRPRQQQVTVSARKGPGGPPEPCGRLVAQRRSLFETPPVQEDEGPQHGRAEVTPGSRRASGPAARSPTGSAEKTVEATHQRRTTVAGCHAEEEQKHASDNVSLSIIKEISQKQPTTSDVRREQDNLAQGTTGKKRQTTSGSHATDNVKNAISVVEDSFREIHQLDTEIVGGLVTGDAHTKNDGDRPCQEKAKPSDAGFGVSDYKMQTPDATATVAKPSDNAPSSKKAVNENAVKQEAGSSAGFSDARPGNSSETRRPRSLVGTPSTHTSPSETTGTAVSKNAGARPAPVPACRRLAPASSGGETEEEYEEEEEEDGAEDNELHDWVVQVRNKKGQPSGRH